MFTPTSTYLPKQLQWRHATLESMTFMIFAFRGETVFVSPAWVSRLGSLLRRDGAPYWQRWGADPAAALDCPPSADHFSPAPIVHAGRKTGM